MVYTDKREQFKTELVYAVQYLKAHPDEIYSAWADPNKHSAGVLFFYAGPDPFNGGLIEGTSEFYGCVTQIKARNDQCGGRCAEHTIKYVAITPEFTKAIQDDPRIPSLITQIMSGGIHEDDRDIALEAFAEWQLKLFDARTCELCLNRMGRKVFDMQICTICEVRLVEDKTYIDGGAVQYDKIPRGLYAGR